MGGALPDADRARRRIGARAGRGGGSRSPTGLRDGSPLSARARGRGRGHIARRRPSDQGGALRSRGHRRLLDPQSDGSRARGVSQPVLELAAARGVAVSRRRDSRRDRLDRTAGRPGRSGRRGHAAPRCRFISGIEAPSQFGSRSGGATTVAQRDLPCGTGHGMTPRARRELRRHLLIYAGLLPFLAIALFPILWMAVTAFKDEADLYRKDVAPFWFHLPPTLKNFELLLHSTYFTASLLNSVLLTACVVVTTLVTAVPAGYALARLRLPWAENLGIAIFVTYLVPSIMLFLPLARVVGTLGLFDS